MAAAASPLDNPTGWISSLSKGATKKVSYNVLDWVSSATGKEEPVPGAQKQETNPKDFMGFLKDGSTLCNLANKLSPGAIETVHEKTEEKDKQLSNIGSFLQFAKDKAGVNERDLFKAEDLISGKGFPSVLSTMVSLGTSGSQKFGAKGLDTEALMQMALQAGGKNFLMSLLDRIPNPFKKSAPAADAAPVEEVKENKGATAASPTENGEKKAEESKPAAAESAPTEQKAEA